jgi:hypothetical protein
MPYSRRERVRSELGWGGDKSNPLKGTINGANMPWIFECNLTLDKTFMLNLAGKKNANENGKRKKKPGMLNLYLEFQNLLNIKNTIAVYEYTGSPDDDGYVSSPLFQNMISNGRVYDMYVDDARNYYNMRIADPYNYGLPFRAVLGIQFSF